MPAKPEFLSKSPVGRSESPPPVDSPRFRGLVTHLTSQTKIRQTSIEGLWRESRASLAHAKRGAKCIAAENPDAQYDVNVFKWCGTICQTTLSFKRLSKEQKELSRSGQMQSRIQTQIYQLHEEFIQLFSRLFSRLAA